ncbi:MAG TPA: SufD family Fe-S cluster assembly protein [Kiloniellales bacterium]|nr:SufD family Fe-S cluster assembly protein [Kiloniellales bacterium]
MRTAQQPVLASLLNLYEGQRERLPGARLPWLQERRRAALKAAERLGLPTPTTEDWRHTPLVTVLGKHEFALAQPVGLDRAPSLLTGAARLVFLDGQGDATLSRPALPEGVTALSLRQALQDDERALADRLSVAPEGTALEALNLGLFQDGALIEVDEGIAAPPVELVFANGLAEGAATSHPRGDVHLAPNASLTLVEVHQGLGREPRLLNHVQRLRLERGARLTHLVVLAEGTDTTHLAETTLSLAQDSLYQGLVLFLGGGLVRRSVTLTLAERGASCTLASGYLLTGEERGDLKTDIRHAAPDTLSRTTVKGALNGRSRQVVRGCITVEAGAARADGRLASKTLLLSDRAEIDAKPELRIFHDDVQCAHGATSGKLDPAQLFYLRSRGVPEPVARRLLIEAFLAELTEGLEDELRQPLQRLIDRKLAEVAP